MKVIESEAAEKTRKLKTLERIPRKVRHRMDRGDIRVSLQSWQRLTPCFRQRMVHAASDPTVSDPEWVRAMLNACESAFPDDGGR